MGGTPFEQPAGYGSSLKRSQGGVRLSPEQLEQTKDLRTTFERFDDSTKEAIISRVGRMREICGGNSHLLLECMHAVGETCRTIAERMPDGYTSIDLKKALDSELEDIEAKATLDISSAEKSN